MPLKLGQWTFNEDGRELTLDLTAVNNDGGVTGNIVLLSRQVVGIVGLWEETSRILVFSPVPPPGTVAVIAKFYKGFLFNTPRNPTLGQDFVWTLAGFVQYTDTVAQERDEGFRSAKRTMFGWFAQIKEVS